jgi:hypothetical protein
MKHTKQNTETPTHVTAEEWAAMSDVEKLDAVHAHRVDQVLMFETVGAEAIKQLLNAARDEQPIRMVFDGELQAACFMEVIDQLESLGVIGNNKLNEGKFVRYEAGVKRSGTDKADEKASQDQPEQLALMQVLAMRIRSHAPFEYLPLNRLTGSDQEREMLEAAYHALRNLDEWLGAKNTHPKKLEPPNRLAQPTFLEMRYAATAIADGRTGRGWSPVPGEPAMIHSAEGELLHAKLTAKPELNWWGEATVTHEHLREQLETLEPAGVLCLQIVTAWVIEENRVTVTLNDLIKLIGWTPRSTAERALMQRKIWIWLELFDAITIHGKRPGTYRDPDTKKKIDLTSADAFIKIVGRRDAQQGQYTFDKENPPVEVSWVPGPWVDAYRNNRQILTDFGNILALTGLPLGKPSGAWALSIGLALNQKWRERASRAEERHKYSTDIKTGERTKTLTVDFDRSFTRYELLDMLRTEPWVEDVLKSSNPQRAQKYWDDAIRILKTRIIGEYKVLDPEPDNRRGWQNFWLREQQLLVLPKPEGIAAVTEIAKRARKINKSAKRRNL